MSRIQESTDIMKKKILFLNMGYFGSTGTIMRDLGMHSSKNGLEPYYVYPENPLNKQAISGDIIMENYTEYRIARKLAFLSGLNGCFAVFPTLRLISRIKRMKPDIIHLHNLHNSYINLFLLFRYLKKSGAAVVWTLHDCWAITGKCPHFQYINCEKWKTGCYECPLFKKYPEARVDRTKFLWKCKAKWFIGIPKMTIVTPSKWLADLTKQSYLKDYRVKVINNGIDSSIFKARTGNLKNKFEIPEGKYIVLGVSLDWGFSKGLDIVDKLAKDLDPNYYQIIIVGITENITEKISERIIKIQRTDNPEELAELYSMANVFINPTREDNYPTVNMEALSCGTPVISFDTGGCKEQYNNTCGRCIEVDEYDKFKTAVIDICENHPISQEQCVQYALHFSKMYMLEKYMRLYKESLL